MVLSRRSFYWISNLVGEALKSDFLFLFLDQEVTIRRKRRRWARKFLASGPWIHPTNGTRHGNVFFRGGGLPDFFQMLRNEAISKPKFIRNYFTDELPCLGTSWKVTDNCNVSPSSWVGSDHVKTLMKNLNNPTL